MTKLGEGFITDTARRLAELVEQINRQTVEIPDLNLKVVCRLVGVREMVEAAILPILRFNPEEMAPEELQAEADKIIAAGRSLLMMVAEAPVFVPPNKEKKVGQVCIDEVSNDGIKAFLEQVIPTLQMRVFRINPLAFDIDEEYVRLMRQDQVLEALDSLAQRYGMMPSEILSGRLDKPMPPEDLAFNLSVMQVGFDAEKKRMEEREQGGNKGKKTPTKG